MFLFFLYLSSLYAKGLQEYSDKFFECINLNKSANSQLECTSINIPEKEGYKCCSMKISYDGNNSYNCFPLETKYANNQTILDEFFLNNSLASLFGSKGGQMVIDCGGINSTQKFEKMSDDYLNCYKSHINGVDNANDCHKYEIPEKEKSKCCFIETLQQDSKGNIIKDKKCYIINDGYFTKEKNLNNYLLDNFNLKSLDQIKNINLTINCKNYDVFNFSSKFEDKHISSPSSTINLNNNNKTGHDNDPQIINKKNSSSSNTGIIVGIVIAIIVVLIGGLILLICLVKKRMAKKPAKTESEATISNNQSRTNNSIHNKNINN